MDVNDDETMVDSGNSWWEDDHIELYSDADGSRPKGYGRLQFLPFTRPMPPTKPLLTVPVSHLPKGLFVVTVQGSKTVKTAKLVITR
jgi:hypothetical protein